MRCQACGSPRLVTHPERDALHIAHVDCDAFFAAVEQRDNPALRNNPLIIGGGKRGVVSTCCYLARTYGVRSAMPMFKALQLCPHATVLKPDIAKYSAVGREVRRMMHDMTPLVQPLSIDEAFLDLTGTELLHHGPPARTLAGFAARVERELGITVSIGLSHNKFLAKMASELDKPRGFSIIGQAETLAFLAARPVGSIWGIGKVAEARLNKAGIRMIADLQQLDEIELMRRFGEEGQRLYRLSRGIDTRRVEPDRDTKSVSAETTFDTDIVRHDALLPILWRLSEKVHARLVKQELAGATINLKLKTADFQIRTRARSLPAPTQLAKRIYDHARQLLAAEPAGVAYRLIGVGVTGLCDPALADKGDLVDVAATREAATEKAIDALRDRFGAAAVGRGIGLGLPKGRPPAQE
jgi:DNA polymerase-4